MEFHSRTSLARVTGLSLSRGKNRDLDRFNAGVLSVTVNNEDRAFDPLYTSSPFYGDIVPRRDVRVLANGTAQYVGKILDWNFDFEPNGRQSASLEAADGFHISGTAGVDSGHCHTTVDGCSGERGVVAGFRGVAGWQIV